MYNLPSTTLVNRVIPKKVFVDQLGANTRMKDHFTNDIEKIEWLAKLAPSTLNVAAGKEVQEITVFQVPLKEKNCSKDLFTFIDSMMPRHTLFILCKEEEASLLLNYKEALTGTGRSEKAFRITRTYQTAWIKQSLLTLRIEGLNMDALYETLVRQVAGCQITTQSFDLKSDITQSTEQEALQRQLENLKKKEANEKQPLIKFELHNQIIELSKNLKQD